MRNEITRTVFSVILLLSILPYLQAQPSIQSKLDRVILPEVSFNGLELSKVAYVLSSFSKIYGTDGKEIKIRAESSGDKSLYDAPVAYNAQNVSLKRVLEDIAAQTGSEIKYLSSSSVVFSAPPKRLTLKQKAEEIRKQNPMWNTHLDDYSLILAYLTHYPEEIKTFAAPASMRSALEAELRKAKLEEEQARKTKLEEASNAQREEEARRSRLLAQANQREQAKSDSVNAEPSNHYAEKVKTQSSSNSDSDGVIAIIIIGGVIVVIIWGLGAMTTQKSAPAGSVNATRKPQKSKETVAVKSTEKEAVAKKTTAKKIAAKKTATKKVPIKKAINSATKTDPASHSNNTDPFGSKDLDDIEFRIALLQKSFERGEISEEEMDRKIRALL